MVNSSKRAGLGNTLNRAQRFANKRRHPKNTDKHTVDLDPNKDSGRVDLRSVTAQTNLDQFFEEAELAGKQFITERRNVAMIKEDESVVDLYTTNEKAARDPFAKLEDINIDESLCVPRRPEWDENTTPEILAEREKLSFLAWRRKLAKLQENENLVLTPFEKNIEVWRQLWRVVERSDIIVQILDARNPLLYVCDDLMKYVSEEFNGQKMNLIMLNKADFLTKEQRRMWLNYFKDRSIKTIFFSALMENENFRKSQKESNAEDTNICDASNDDVAGKLKDNLKIATNDVDEDIRIYNKFELLDEWRELLNELEKSRPKLEKNPTRGDIEHCDHKSETSSSHTRPLTVGLVGYPNVGKSSTINALLSAKRTAVSATPGKTKHFQTFLIDRDMMLCDCPGLVFPNFVTCKAEMVINGVLPIDQMKDYVGPVRIIVNRIPRAFFEDLYGLAFEFDAKQNIVADDLLNALGFMRGYMTARGLPDISRAARKVCKDYINGKILYCEPPPNVDPKLYHSHSILAEAMKRVEAKNNNRNSALKITERQRRLMRQAKGAGISAREFDAQYFQARTGGAHIIGLPGIGNMTQPIGQPSIQVATRERKHKKREKLRRVYRDLDV